MILFNRNILRSVFTFLFLQNLKPTYLLFFVTNKCEGRCKHCFYWKETNKIIPELSIVEITELAKKLGPMLQVTITGGSPELREDLYEIIDAFVKHCTPINITLCSNGNHPDLLYRTVKKLLSGNRNLCITIDISLDGPEKEHDNIRGINGIFNNVNQSYFLLNELRKEYSNLRLGCGLVVSGYNSDIAAETADWAINNLPIDNFTPILIRGEPREPEALKVNPDKFKEVAERVEELLIKGRLRGYSAFSKIINSKDIIQKQLIYDIYKEQKSIIRCSALRETALVYPEGTVSCCELRDESLGNLRDSGMNLRDLWQSPKARELRAKVKKDNCFCWHQCFLSASIVKSPKMWYRSIKHFLRQHK